MKRPAPIVALVTSLIVLAACVGAAVIASSTQESAGQALQSASSLLAARKAVARATEQLGRTRLHDAVVSARRANSTARRAGRVTKRILNLLTPTQRQSQAILSASEQAARGAAVTRRQTKVAGNVLATIAAYQRVASTNARRTNRALERIVTALRKTNRSFPNLPPR